MTHSVSTASLVVNIVANVDVRSAQTEDLNALLALEEKSFTGDRLSRRSFRHAITSSGSALLVAINESGLLGYALLHLRQGTHLARLYSLAVAPEARGLGGENLDSSL